jgi:hypothetical protein
MEYRYADPPPPPTPDFHLTKSLRSDEGQLFKKHSAHVAFRWASKLVCQNIWL